MKKIKKTGQLVVLGFLLMISFQQCMQTPKTTNTQPEKSKTKISFDEYTIKNDTLWILSGDDFLYHPFGSYKTQEQFISAYPFMNRKTLLTNDIELDNFYFGKSSITVLFDDDKSNNLDKMNIVDAKISDPDVILANNIKTGMQKSEFLDFLSIQLSESDKNKINVVLLESELLGMLHYYCFNNNILDSIVFKTDYQFDLLKANTQPEKHDTVITPFMKSIQKLELLQLPLTFFCGADTYTWADELGDDIVQIVPKDLAVVGRLPIAGTGKTYIIYAKVGDIIYPYLYTYDKAGRQTDSLYLHIGYCSADDAETVSNTTTINSDCTINMTDTTKYIHYDSEAVLHTDSIIIRKRDMNLNVNGLYTVSNEQQYGIK